MSAQYVIGLLEEQICVINMCEWSLRSKRINLFVGLPLLLMLSCFKIYLDKEQKVLFYFFTSCEP